MEREEGELTDEDLEDVSDNSSELSIALAGKSPLREPFREISLTSISDDSDSLLLEKSTYRHISRDLYRKPHRQHHRREAGNSKRARRFSHKQRKSNHRKDYSSVSSSSDDDNYKNKTILRQLRDAVRINRSQNLPNCSLRTRLKRMIEQTSEEDDDNLEILRDQALQSKTKPENQKDDTPETVNDEDLEQLRLIALKSAVLKKHAERRKRKEEQLKQEQKEQQEQLKQEQKQQQSESIEEDEDILRAMLLTSISKKIADKKLPDTNKINNYKLPVIPPLNRFIIKVNSDSESSDENGDANKPIQQINPKSDIFDKSLSLFLQQARAKTEEEKTKSQSDISHLPRSQQLEYKRLKRKLQILSTRMKPGNKVRKIAPDGNKSAPDENRSAPDENKSAPAAANNFRSHRKDEDRLMIKGKYEELTPLMGRVSEARNARDKAQADVKRLINNLKIARAQLTANHQEYTVLVQQLVKAKADIDKRAENQETIRTSTPTKLIKENTNTNNVSVSDSNVVPAKNTPINEIQMMDIVEETVVLVPEFTHKKERDSLQKERDSIKKERDSIKKERDSIKKERDSPLLKYNSPLEHIQLTRKQPLQNPLLELCPYDLLGVCRDADCSYQHCGSNANITD